MCAGFTFSAETLHHEEMRLKQPRQPYMQVLEAFYGESGPQYGSNEHVKHRGIRKIPLHERCRILSDDT